MCPKKRDHRDSSTFSNPPPPSYYLAQCLHVIQTAHVVRALRFSRYWACALKCRLKNIKFEGEKIYSSLFYHFLHSPSLINTAFFKTSDKMTYIFIGSYTPISPALPSSSFCQHTLPRRKSQQAESSALDLHRFLSCDAYVDVNFYSVSGLNREGREGED